MRPGRKKGTPKTGGRRKGTPNRKIIEQIEASALTPLDAEGLAGAPRRNGQGRGALLPSADCPAGR